LKNIKALLLNFILFFTSVVAILFICEITLRIFPLKGIEMGTSDYDDEIGLYKFTPNSKFIRTNIRNQKIIRDVNSQGFLDIEHKKTKGNNVYRIGFFGDSYVEAFQVELKNTFFRMIQDSLGSDNIEIFAFGKSGQSAFHSYLISEKYKSYYDLDLIVYVFVENELGDHLEVVKKANSIPYPILIEGELALDNTSLEKYLLKKEKSEVFKKIILYKRSFLIQTIYKRFKLLMKYGVNTTVKKEDFEMSTRADNKSTPNQNDLPSTWDKKIKEKAEIISEKVILVWSDNIKKENKDFAIFYVPREGEWDKKDSDQDSWKNWLRKITKLNSLTLIDPTSVFHLYKEDGHKLYDDHFSVNGHRAFANSFINWFKNR
jgi:hypothetical protein